MANVFLVNFCTTVAFFAYVGKERAEYKLCRTLRKIYNRFVSIEWCHVIQLDHIIV